MAYINCILVITFFVRYVISNVIHSDIIASVYSGTCVSNSKKEKKMKNFGAYQRIGIFYLTPFPCTNLHDFWVSGVF